MPQAQTSADGRLAGDGTLAAPSESSHQSSAASLIRALQIVGAAPADVLAPLADWLSAAIRAPTVLVAADHDADRWVPANPGSHQAGNELPPGGWAQLTARAEVAGPSRCASPVHRQTTADGVELTILSFRTGFAILAFGDVHAHRPLLELTAGTAGLLLAGTELKVQLSGLAEEQIEIGRLLAIRDVDQLLLSTVNTANQLIDADMAGVMLGDRDDLIMECCVGNRSRKTEQLRFAKGQGVAGLVMERAEPCKVDDYLASDVITHDFDSLARIEETRSALAAPLIVNGTPIGVLEVWRRRPSRFTNGNVRQLVTLANLTAIAIDNARLHAQKAESLDRLGQTMDSLSHQLRIVEQARSTQTTLSQLLLGGEGVDSIIRAIGLQLDARIVLLSSQLEVLSTWPRALRVDDIVERLRSGTSLDSPNVGDLSVELEPGRWLTAQPVRTRSDHRGWFCAVLPEPPGVGEELVIGEAVTVIALCQVMERAAEEARIGERQTLVWDLIEGPIGQRRAAVDRARWLRVDLDRVRRLIRAEIHPTGSSRRERWDEADYEQARYRVLTKVRAAAIKSGAGDFVAMRGNELAVIVNDAEPTILRRLVATLDDAAGEVLQWHKVAWGVSSSCQTLLDLDQANREAISAVRAAVRLGLDELMYEDLGVAGLIVSDDDGDLSSFLRDVIGPLVEHDVERRSELVDTLRAYFAVDYSHRHAAERLHIHHKTFRYRLGKIERLTGLDLRSHEGRMRADLALKLLDVTAGDAMPVAETSPSGAPSKTRQR